MHVSDLSLEDFRSYRRLVVSLEPGVTALIGPNGQGKTNLIEAVDYLSGLSSHRAGADTALVRRAEALRTGPIPEEEAFFGPLNNERQLERVSRLVEERPAHSALLTGGHRVGQTGYYYAPTVISGLRQEDRLIQEEIFGPVLTVQVFDDDDEALAMANGVDYALSSSIWTADHRRVLRFSRDLDFGCVWVNTHIPLVAEMPHGGFKRSGYGKDLSVYGVEDYTRVKHVMSAL